MHSSRHHRQLLRQFWVHFKLLLLRTDGMRNAEPNMGPTTASPCRLRRPSHLSVMGWLLLLGASDAAAVVLSSRGSSFGSRIQPLARSSSCRTRVTSTTSTTTMALDRNPSRSRPGHGKHARVRRGGCGGTPGGADGRAGVRARARRTSYYGESSSSGSRGSRGGGEPLGFFDVGDVVWGVGRQQKRSAGAAGARGSGFGKAYQPTRTAGGTFTARGLVCVFCIFFNALLLRTSDTWLVFETKEMCVCLDVLGLLPHGGMRTELLEPFALLLLWVSLGEVVRSEPVLF